MRLCDCLSISQCVCVFKCWSVPDTQSLFSQSIKDLQMEQFGDYECSTFNIVLGHDKSDSITISVFDK